MTTQPAVLVVDDDPNYREMIVLMGQMWGIVVLEAGDCGQAGAVVRSPGFLDAAVRYVRECIARVFNGAGSDHLRHIAVQEDQHQ